MIINWYDHDEPIDQDEVLLERPSEEESDDDDSSELSDESLFGGGSDQKQRNGSRQNNAVVVEKRYTLYALGRTQMGKSVCLRVLGFTPFFYVKCPMYWRSNAIFVQFFTSLRKKLGRRGAQLLRYKKFMKKDAYGFTNQELFAFLRFDFSSHGAMTSCKYFIQKNQLEDTKFHGLEVYNGNIPSLQNFMHIRQILASGWIKLRSDQLIKCVGMSRCELNYETDWKHVTHLEGSESFLLPPLKVCSFDLECFSTTGAFPNPTNPGDIITQIGHSLLTYGREPFVATVFVHGPCDPVPGTEIISCHTEADLLLQWSRRLGEDSPDIIIGYNIDDFDWNYIYERAKYLEILNLVLANISRFGKKVPGEFTISKQTAKLSNARPRAFIRTPGTTQIDLLHWFRANEKLDSYKLDFVAETFLKEHKRPVTPQQIFRMSGPIHGTSASRAIVADYCAQDCALPLRLMNNRCMIPNLVEMSKCVGAEIEALINRGQQYKVVCQVGRVLRERNFLLPDIKNKNPLEIQGATVLSCKKGAHFHPVCGLDFKSLYPSIMICHNFCLTTLVRDSKYHLESENIATYEWKDSKSQYKFQFATKTEGVVPYILRRLWGERDAVKREMKNETNPDMREILNAKQLAIKVSMNSIYGCFGASAGALCVNAIAACVTYVGRTMIGTCVKYVTTNYGTDSNRPDGITAEVLYGDTDSVYVKFVLPDGNELSQKDLVEKTWKVGQRCADELTQLFQTDGGVNNPKEMEMEKIMLPLFLYRKKGYIYGLIDHPSKWNDIKIKYTGVPVVRRDFAPIVKQILEEIVGILIYKRDINLAEQTARDRVKELLENRVDLAKLVLSKTLRDNYITENKQGKAISQPAHFHLANRMRERDPMNAPKAGDRVQFVYIDLDANSSKRSKKSKDAILQSDRIEDPDYIREHNLKPDVLYIFEHQLKQPLFLIFSILKRGSNGSNQVENYPLDAQGNLSKQSKQDIERRIWMNSLIKKVNERNAQRDIVTMFKSLKV